MRTTQTIGQSPFEPIPDFRPFASDPTARVVLKEPAMIQDLQLAIDTSRKLHEALVCAKGAQISGGDPEPILADAVARLVEVSNAMGRFSDPMDAPADVDSAQMVVEGADMRSAAE